LLYVVIDIATIVAFNVVTCTSQLLAWHFHNNNELQTKLWFNLHFNILQ